jgi:hypothetical protein
MSKKGAAAEVEKVQCKGSVCLPTSKHQYAEGTAFRYLRERCPAFCVPGSKDPLCKRCSTRKAKGANYHGNYDEPVPNSSHTVGSKWNRDLREKEMLARLRSISSVKVYEPVPEAVKKATTAVKKAATVVAAAEKQKAAAVVVIEKANRAEEAALNSASAAVAKVTVPPRLPAARKESAARSIPRANTASRKKKTSSSGSKSKSRRARRLSSGSIRGLAGTPRERSPGMISSPNIAEVNSGYSTNVPVYPEDVRKYTLGSMGRPMERIPLPAPRGPKIASMD